MIPSQLNEGYLYQKRIWIVVIRLIDWLLSVFFRRKKRKSFYKGDVKKILLVKIDHLGDVLMTTSVFPMIKNYFPDAKLDIVLGKWSREIVEGNPHIDEYIIYNHFRHNRTGNLFQKVREHFTTGFLAVKKLRKERYDLCFVLRAYGQNGILLAKIGGCKYIVGHATGGFGPLLDEVVEWEEGVHETKHYLEVLAAIMPHVKAVTNFNYQLFYQEKDKEYVHRVIQKYQLHEFVIIHPGSSNPMRMWDVENWKVTAAMLVKRGLRVVITGTACEQQLACKISSGSDFITDLTGMFTIRQLAYFFRCSRTIFTVESLSAHLGRLSGTRTLVIWGGTTNAYQWAPLGDNVIIIKKAISCSPCYKSKGCAQLECLKVKPKELLERTMWRYR